MSSRRGTCGVLSTREVDGMGYTFMVLIRVINGMISGVTGVIRSMVYDLGYGLTSLMDD